MQVELKLLLVLVLVLVLVIEKLKHSRIIRYSVKCDSEYEYDHEDDSHGIENPARPRPRKLERTEYNEKIQIRS